MKGHSTLWSQVRLLATRHYSDTVPTCMRNNDCKRPTISQLEKLSQYRSRKPKTAMRQAEENHPRMSFSHRALAIHQRTKPKVVRPKVHKLVPAEIAQKIRIRYLLDRLPSNKKNLQPQMVCRSGLAVEQRLARIEPCESYRKSMQPPKNQGASD